MSSNDAANSNEGEAVGVKALAERIAAITARTGYPHEVTVGQRKYGGPPPDWNGPLPGPGSEVYCGKIPKGVFEDELIPLFEQYGKIYDLRLMMDPATGTNKGFGFCMLSNRAEAERAAKALDGYEIRPNKKLKANISIPNCRLFIGNIPKTKTKEEIQHEFSSITEGLVDVIIYSQADNPKKKNRGFCFLDFETHKDASEARKKLLNSGLRPFNRDILVDWAEPQDEPDADTMAKVKVLYVRNLKLDVTEAQMMETFSAYGAVEKVKKIKDYGFIHFMERDDAIRAMEALNGTMINDSEMLITLAKPPSDNKNKDMKNQMQAGFPTRGRGYGMRGARGRGLGLAGLIGRGGMMKGGLGRASMLGRLAAAQAAYEMDYYGYDDYGYYDDSGYYDDGYYNDYSGYGLGYGPGGYGRGLGLAGLLARGAGRRRAGLTGVRGRGAGLAALRGKQQPGVSLLGSLGRGGLTDPMDDPNSVFKVIARGKLPAGSAAGAVADPSSLFKVIAQGKLPAGETAGLGLAGLRGGAVKRIAGGDFSQMGGKAPRLQGYAEQAIAQQPLGELGYEAAEAYAAGTGEEEWYQDTFTGSDQW